jgi:hypothetical protein
VVIVVEVQTGQLAQHGTVVELRVGLTRENLDVVPAGGELPAEVAQVDTLAPGVRLAAIRQQCYAQRTID